MCKQMKVEHHTTIDVACGVCVCVSALECAQMWTKCWTLGCSRESYKWSRLLLIFYKYSVFHSVRLLHVVNSVCIYSDEINCVAAFFLFGSFLMPMLMHVIVVYVFLLFCISSQTTKCNFFLQNNLLVNEQIIHNHNKRFVCCCYLREMLKVFHCF